MKKYIVVFLISLISANYLLAENTSSLKNPDLGFYVKIYVKFHKPKLDCERGFGICIGLDAGVEGPQPSSKVMCPVNAQLNEMNQLVFEVAESDLRNYENSSTLPYFEGKKTIEIDEPFTIPESISRTMGSVKPITVMPGSYPVTYSKQTYTIVFFKK